MKWEFERFRRVCSALHDAARGEGYRVKPPKLQVQLHPPRTRRSANAMVRVPGGRSPQWRCTAVGYPGSL